MWRPRTDLAFEDREQLTTKVAFDDKSGILTKWHLRFDKVTVLRFDNVAHEI